MPLALAASALLATACYRSVETPPSALQPGATVQLDLSADGERELAAKLGPETVRIDGRVERVDGDAVAMVVSRTTKRFGGTVPWIGERVTVPLRDVAHVRAHVVDRRRTVLTAIGAAGAAIAAIALLMGQSGGGSGDQGGGGGGPTP